jgi:hypothetical protein
VVDHGLRCVQVPLSSLDCCAQNAVPRAASSAGRAVLVPVAASGSVERPLLRIVAAPQNRHGYSANPALIRLVALITVAALFAALSWAINLLFLVILLFLFNPTNCTHRHLLCTSSRLSVLFVWLFVPAVCSCMSCLNFGGVLAPLETRAVGSATSNQVRICSLNRPALTCSAVG